MGMYSFTYVLNSIVERLNGIKFLYVSDTRGYDKGLNLDNMTIMLFLMH